MATASPLAVALVAAAALAATPAAATSSGVAAPDVVLTGDISGQDHQTYREAPFTVPAGVTRITVRFEYDKSAHTVIDLGLLDPERFRGWSGGSKSLLTIAPSDATPSYLPGPVIAGRWQLLMGVPNARPGSRSHYTARIWFDRGDGHAATDAAAPPPLRTGEGWYRGDLHMHGAHSDGSCASQSGAKVPCPTFRTVEAAAAARLDFIALSDHNTVSQMDDIRELQPWFDKLLLMPATEITTFHGHIQAIGLRRFVDFRLGTPHVPTMRALADDAAKAGAILSINHADLPSGEICMGCGWTAPGTPYDRLTAIEVVNAKNADGPLSGFAFWYARLNEGHHLTGIGGSDSHDPDAPDGRAPVGRPTTVVHARALSQDAILDGIRSGDVFIDVEGKPGRLLEVEAQAGAAHASMGGTLAPKDGALTLDIHAVGVEGGVVEIVHKGQPLPETTPVASADARAHVTLLSEQACGWVAVNVRDGKGAPLLVGNPVYVDCR